MTKAGYPPLQHKMPSKTTKKKKKNLKGRYGYLVTKWCLFVTPHGLQPSRLFCPQLPEFAQMHVHWVVKGPFLHHKRLCPQTPVSTHTSFQSPQLLPDLRYVSSPWAGRGISLKDEQRRSPQLSCPGSSPTQGAYETKKIPQHLK